MTYREMVTEAKRIYHHADASGINQHIAIQFNVTGLAQGIFYLEINNGKVNVQPFSYYDHDAVMIGSAEAILDMMSRKISINQALKEDKISIEGDYDKIEAMNKIIL